MPWAEIIGGVVAAIAGAGALWVALRRWRQDKELRNGAVAEHQVQVNREIDKSSQRARERREKTRGKEWSSDDVLDRFDD